MPGHPRLALTQDTDAAARHKTGRDDVEKIRGGIPMAYETILYEVEDEILTITLNRPDKLNAFTTKMMTELIDAFDRADEDDAVKAVIVTGAGRAFCAGADLSAGAATFGRASCRERV